MPTRFLPTHGADARKKRVGTPAIFFRYGLLAQRGATLEKVQITVYICVKFFDIKTDLELVHYSPSVYSG